jgi:hypothetical protein
VFVNDLDVFRTDVIEYCGARMDFIERWLGVSPDGGNGTLEATLLVVVAVVLAGPLVLRMLRSTRRRREE